MSTKGDPPGPPEPEPNPESESVPALEMESSDSGKFKGQTIGIDTDRLEAYIATLKWKIRPDGHTKKVVDQIRDFQKEYEKEMKVLEKNPESLTYAKEEAYEKATKGILEAALIGFNYEEAANNVDAGPGALGILSNELRTFLVDLGGRVGQKHLQMLSKLVTQKGSTGLKT